LRQFVVAVVAAAVALTWSLAVLGPVGTVVALWLSPLALVPAVAVWAVSQSRRVRTASLPASTALHAPVEQAA
jgi:hypothetical protein